MKNVEIKNIFVVFSACIVSALMLTVIQEPFDLWWFGWVCLVPFIIVCSPGAKLRPLVIISYIVSFVYWLGNLYWIGPVTWMGWAAFCLYTAFLWPILVLAIRFCRVKKIALFIAVPILFVGAEQLQGLFLGGFRWRFLGYSQYTNTVIIQIADIFGAAGVSFLVAMVNGLAAGLIIAAKQKKLFKAGLAMQVVCVLAILAGTIAYGRWRIEQSGDFVEDGPLAASIQSNVPQTVKESNQSEEVIFEQLLEQSRAAFKSGAELSIWPETMVQGSLDKRILRVLEASSYHRVFDTVLKEHSRKNGFVLVGAMGGTPKINEDLSISYASRYNSAFLYLPDGTQAEQQYSKIHLVPYGEVVPFKESLPWMHRLLMKFTPYDYDYSLDAGTEYTVFEMTGKNKQIYKFGVMICYEGTIAKIARNFAIDAQGEKKVDWLVNISNDGWFVRFDQEEVFPATELSQHTAVCVFRAVENRVAILRSVNTGISCLIDSLGRLRNSYIASSAGFPANVMSRAGIAGWFTDKVPIDKRVTFFSRFGQWLDFCCAAGLCLVIIGSAAQGFLRKKANGK